MIKKHLIIIIVCCFISFLFASLYPVKKEIYLCVKNFVYSKTVVSSNEIVAVNYKREQNDENTFIVSKSAPFLDLMLDGRYIKNVQINFKEPLQENLKFKIFVEKESNIESEENLFNNMNVETLVEKISYKTDINDVIKNIVFVIGENLGDKFVFDSIVYFEDYKYYFNNLVNYNYFKQIKNKSFWHKFSVIFVFFMLFIEYFVIRKIIYKKIKMKKN